MASFLHKQELSRTGNNLLDHNYYRHNT